jgi:hypothetical protein
VTVFALKLLTITVKAEVLAAMFYHLPIDPHLSITMGKKKPRFGGVCVRAD